MAGFLFFQEEFLCISTGGGYRGGVFGVAGSAGMLLACLLAVSSNAVFVFFSSFSVWSSEARVCLRIRMLPGCYTYVYFGLIII